MGLNCGQSDGVDRDALIEAVAAAQPRTVVVLQSGGPVADAVARPGPGAARGLVPRPERRHRDRPRAVRRRRAGGPPARDVPAAPRPTSPSPATRRSTPASPRPSATRRASSSATAGSTSASKDVAYPFGFGLAYTTFSFSGLRLEPSRTATRASARSCATPARAPGSAVPQLYVGMPEPGAGVVQPPRQLKGFASVRLEPGESQARHVHARRARVLLLGRRRTLGASRPAATGSASARTRATLPLAGHRRPRRRRAPARSSCRATSGRARRGARSRSACRAALAARDA